MLIALTLPLPFLATVGMTHQDFRVRQKATYAMAARIGPGDWKWADTVNSPELHMRVRLAGGLSARTAVDRVTLFMPYADSAWYDPAVGYKPQTAFEPEYVEQLRRYLCITPHDAVGRPADEGPFRRHRVATRWWVEDALREGKSEEYVRTVLGRMFEAERGYELKRILGPNKPVDWGPAAR